MHTQDMTGRHPVLQHLVVMLAMCEFVYAPRSVLPDPRLAHVIVCVCVYLSGFVCMCVCVCVFSGAYPVFSVGG